jgi:hypothetical protein
MAEIAPSRRRMSRTILLMVSQLLLWTKLVSAGLQEILYLIFAITCPRFYPEGTIA